MNPELKEILDRMEVPEDRKQDLRWLQRNLAVRNILHPEFFKARELLIKQLKEKK